MGPRLSRLPAGILTKAKDDDDDEDNVGEDFDLRGVQGVPDVPR